MNASSCRKLLCNAIVSSRQIPGSTLDGLRRNSSDRRRVVLARGGDGRRESAGDDGNKIDWDGAWNSFQRQQGTGGEQTKQGQRRRPPTRSFRKATSPLDEIKSQENAAVSPWNSTLFTQLGIAAVVLLLIVMVSVAGGEIHDSRCTLPWC